MSLRKGSKIQRGYATVTDDDGVNYRNISDTMTELGFKMNHSSARNYVIRVMKKFAVAYADHLGHSFTDQKLEEVIRTPEFQSTISDVLHSIEHQRRKVTKKR